MHTRYKFRESNTVFLLLSFSVPVLILLIVMSLRDIWPFGKLSLLLWDMEIQYVNIYNWYYDVLHGNASLFYDFSKSLGGNMYGIFATYLSSPINLFVYFFPKDKILYFICLATLVKIGLSGLLCQFFLTERFSKLPFRICFLFSISYAMMEYAVGLCSNLHFLDPIYLLPLMALGTYRLVVGKKSLLLCLSIGFTLICNWYIGIFCCLGIAVYFLFELSSFYTDLLNCVKLSLRFSLRAMIGGLIGSSLLLPCFMATLTGKGGIALERLYPHFHCDFFEPLKALSLWSRANTSYTEPAIFTGGLVLVILIIELLNKDISWKAKWIALFPILLLYLSFSFVPIETLFSALTVTYSFHFRYSFLFSFFLVVGAAALLERTLPIQRHYCLEGILTIALLLIWEVYAYTKGFFSSELNHQRYLIILLIYLFLIICLPRKAYPINFQYLMISFLLCIELGTNAWHSFGRYRIPISDYTDYVRVVGEKIDDIKENDRSFYRIEKTFSEMDIRRGADRPVATESLTFNYNSITHYSSLLDSRVNQFLSNMGYMRADGRMANYVTTNPLSDSLLCVKYLLTNNKVAELDEVDMFSAAGDDSLFVYRNPYAIDLVMEVKKGTVDHWDKDPFQNQLSIVNAITNQDTNIFIPQTFEQNGNGVWTVKLSHAGPVYLYFTEDHESRELFVNGEYLETYFGRFHKNIAYLGSFNLGDTILVELKEDQDCTQDHGLVVYSLDEIVYKKVLQSLKEKSIQPKMVSDTALSIISESKEARKIMLTIPWDAGWTVNVDGNIIVPELAFDTFITLDLASGQHTIDLHYIPPFLELGILMSVVGIICSLLLGLYEKTTKRDNNDLL